MRFLIIVPKYERSALGLDPFYSFPLGPAYISSTLKNAGHAVEVLDLNQYYGYVQDRNWAPLRMLIERHLNKNSFDVLCTGGLSPDYDHIKKIIDIAKAIRPEIKTVVGGGLISSMPEPVMSALQADFGIIGEGEETIFELANLLEHGQDNCSEISGLVYLDPNGQIIKTSPRISRNDINTIPFPDYEGFNIDYYLSIQMPTDHHFWYPYDYPRQIPVIASRSCTHKCTFCYHPEGQKYRQRSIDSVFSEIDFLISKYNINMVTLSDELLGTNKKWLLAFCEKIMPYGIKWTCQLHIGNLDPEVLHIMKRSGCLLISYGLESASDAVLKSMNKRISVSQIDTALAATYDAKIQIQGNFIFGDPAETIETALETLTWWFNHRKYLINLNRVTPFPGSALFEHAYSKGLVPDRIKAIENECDLLFKLNLSSMSIEQSSYIGDLANLYTINIGRCPARVLSARRTGIHPKRGAIFDLDIQCPHCGVTVSYHNMHVKHNPWSRSMLKVRMGCRECYQRYDIFPYDLEEKLLSIFEKTPMCRLAVFKADHRANLLLRNSILLREHTQCIIDNDYKKIISDMSGIRIIPISFNMNYIKNNIDLILVTSKLSPDELFMESCGIELCHISDYFGDNRIFTSQEQAMAYIQEQYKKAGKATSLQEVYYIMLHLIELFHDFLQPHVLLSDVALRLGDLETAIDAISTANVISPNNPDILNKLDHISLLKVKRCR